MATGRVRAADICDLTPKTPLGCDSQLYSKVVEYENDSLDVPHPSVIRVATTCLKSFSAIFTIAPTGTCRNFVFRFSFLRVDSIGGIDAYGTFNRRY
jgi:hypothetical protein